MTKCHNIYLEIKNNAVPSICLRFLQMFIKKLLNFVYDTYCL